MMPTGMPRPLSSTVTEPSKWMVTSIRVQKPPRCSSTALSTTSQTRWCRPEPSWTSPMYMPGRLRTASRPSRTVMLVLSYVGAVVGGVDWGVLAFDMGAMRPDSCSASWTAGRRSEKGD